MDTLPQDSAPATPVALGVLTAVVYVAGFATVAAWFALAVLEPAGGPSAPRAAATCASCGVVASVRELPPAPPPALEGSRAEATVALIAALGGARAEAPQRALYETTVQHDDGSVRVLRDPRPPHWQAGDRVRVVMGRVAPEARAEER